MKKKPILCVDFDGVIHAYTSPWEGPLIIADGVVPGFFEWLDEATKHFKVVVYSSRSKEPGGCDAMKEWLAKQWLQWFIARDEDPTDSRVDVEYAHEKPAAFLTLDDRAICFDGHWPDPKIMLQFKPWNRKQAVKE